MTGANTLPAEVFCPQPVSESQGTLKFCRSNLANALHELQSALAEDIG